MASPMQTMYPQNNIYTVQGMHTVPITGPPMDQRQRFHHEFLKGQPKSLGATQIMVAFMYISLGTVLLFTLDIYVSIGTYSGISYWGALFYIISGSLSISAENKQSVSLIQASLAMNIISSLVSITAVGLYCFDIAYMVHNFYPPCSGLCDTYSYYVFILRETALSFLVAVSLLEFCVSVSVSAFGCRSLGKGNTSPPEGLVMANDSQNQNFAMNPAQFANMNQFLPDQNSNTMNAGNFRIPKVSTIIQTPDYVPSNATPVYPSLPNQ